jgi:DNA-binding protein YbaB
MEDTQAVQTTGDGATQAIADPAAQTMPSIEGVEQALLEGDLSKLTADQRVAYYRKTCESTGLNPLTRPFEYIRLNGDLTLYARKGATDQLRRINGVSITQIEKDYEPNTGLYTVTAYARDEEGRTDVDEGVVSAPGGGDALANARMKAMTKAKRRVTLSICGLGWLDESELGTIPSAEAVDVDHETGEVREPAQVRDGRTISQPQRKRLFAIAKNEGGYTEAGLRRLIDAHGYDSTRDITREDYDEIIEDAYREKKARNYNADPAQTDAFDSGGEPTGEQEEASFEDDLEALEEDLAQAMEADTHEARQEQVSAAMEAFSEAYPQPSASQRDAIMEVYEPVRAELASADAEGQSQAADDMLEGNTALGSPDDAGES